jgi:hypothetical protein
MIKDMYKLNGLWVFNEEYLGLKAELFVPDATEVLDMVLAKTKFANNSTHTVIFGEELPEYDAEFILEEDFGTSCNYSYDGKVFWLCGVTFMYFKTAPKKFYIKFIN